MDIEGHAPCLRESLNLFLSLTIQFPAFLFALSTPLWLPERRLERDRDRDRERERERKKEERKKEKEKEIPYVVVVT